MTFSIWFLAVAGLLILIRRLRGKAVFPKAPVDALFDERRASGDFADRMLLVALTHDALIIEPMFPFNLIPFWEIFGHEKKIPVRSITHLYTIPGFLRDSALVYHGPEDQSVRLILRDHDEFIRELRMLRPDLPAD